MHWLSQLFSIAKKIILVAVVFTTAISCFLYFVQSSRHEAPQINYLQLQKDELYRKVADPELNKTESGKLAAGVYRKIVCNLIGETCTDNPKEAPEHNSASFIGTISNWVASPWAVPPSSGVSWFHYTMENAGLVPNAYAAEGIGFSSVKGYLGLWSLFRNIAFILLIVIMLSIGFMIMFRVKIDPQTVISIENVLPRIVITMLIISFSFAIVGVLIDAMYLLIGMSVDIIMRYGQGHDAVTVASYQNDFMGAKFNDLWPPGKASWSFFGAGSALWNMVPGEFKSILDVVLTKYIATFLVQANLLKWADLLTAANGTGFWAATFGVDIGNTPQLIKFIITLVATGAISYFIPGIILGLIIVLTILFLMFKIFFILLSSYLKIILYLIFAPIILLFEAIPGKNMFSWWIRNVIGELLVFPTVVVVMLIGNAILDVNGTLFINNLYAGSSFVHPADGTFLLPFLYGFRPQDFTILIGLGLILLTPDFIKMVKGWVGIQETGLNLSLGTFFGGGAALFGGVMGGLNQYTSLKHSLVGMDPSHGLLTRYSETPVLGGIVKFLQGGGRS